MPNYGKSIWSLPHIKLGEYSGYPIMPLYHAGKEYLIVFMV